MRSTTEEAWSVPKPMTHCETRLTQLDMMIRTGTIVNISEDFFNVSEFMSSMAEELPIVAPIMAIGSSTLFSKSVQNSPNPAGAPGKLALTDENANNAPIGTTNISE